MAQFLPFHRFLLYWLNYSYQERCDCVPSPWIWLVTVVEPKPRDSWGWMKKGGSRGNFAFGIQLPCHEEAQAACGQACMERTKGTWLSSQLSASTNLPATWMSLLKSESYSPKLSLPAETKWNKDELLLLNPAHVTDSVNKINDCYCFEPLNLEVVCYTAIDNDTMDTTPTEVSLTICIKIADSYTLLPDILWGMYSRYRLIYNSKIIYFQNNSLQHDL